MVRLALLIMGLLSVFLLNACGGSNNSSNIDTRDAVFLQKGSFNGKLERVPVAEYDSKSKKVVKKAQPAIFDTDHSEVEVDWSSKKVTILTQLASDAGKEKSEIVLEGTFNDEGIAYLFPASDNAKGKSVEAIAGVRCKDNKCERLTIDMGAKIDDKNGNKKFREEQMDIVNPSPLKLEAPVEVVKEVESAASSGLQDTGTTTAPVAPATPKKETTPATKTPVVGAKQPVATPVKTAADKKAEEERLRQEREYGEFSEPEGETTILPSVIRPDMTPGAVKLGDYSESTLFPFNLGEKYSGKAQGNYATECRGRGKTRRCAGGALNKATGVTINVAAQTTTLSQILGFFSVSLNDRRYYGSGLLVKTIEEAGKLYNKIFPGQYFEVNDMSQSGGGRIRPHQSHQNGLDADILIPKKNGSNDYAKAWGIVKSFVSLGYVDVIFLNPTRISAMCKYLKTSGEKDYSAIFNKLYPEKGHTSHLHIRLKCTNHNIGCFPKKLTPSKYAVCR